MKAYLSLALLLFTSLAHAASPWEALTEKVLREGTLLESNFGATKHLERRREGKVAYLTIEIHPETGQAKRYSAVIELWEQTPEGKFTIDQHLLWFTPLGELGVVSRYLITLKADRSFESRKEITYGVEPDAADISRWNSLLEEWVKEI